MKTESYSVLQHALNERGVSSFLEMIWPLPGETFNSFKDGINQLCLLEADSYLVYPLLLIGNVEMTGQQEEFAMLSNPDPNSEARIVIETRDVCHKDYLEGVRIIYHVTSLYSLHGLWFVARYLNDSKSVSYMTLYPRFGGFCRSHPDHPYMKFIEGTIAASEQYKFFSVLRIYYPKSS